MAIYVDPLINWKSPTAPKCFQNKSSCHMYADTLDELHTFALRVGLKRDWFQNHSLLPHYDLTEGRRRVAVKLGAIEQNREDAVTTWRRLSSKS